MDLQSPVWQGRTASVALTPVAASPAASQPVLWALQEQIFTLWLLRASAAAAGRQQLRFLGVYGGGWNWAVGFHPEFCSWCLTPQRPFLSFAEDSRNKQLSTQSCFVFSLPCNLPLFAKCWCVPYVKCNGMRKKICHGHSSTSCLSNSGMIFPGYQWLQAERQPNSSHTHEHLLLVLDKPWKDTQDGESQHSTA